MAGDRFKQKPRRAFGETSGGLPGMMVTSHTEDSLKRCEGELPASLRSGYQARKGNKHAVHSGVTSLSQSLNDTSMNSTKLTPLNLRGSEFMSTSVHDTGRLNMDAYFAIHALFFPPRWHISSVPTSVV